MLVGKSFGSEVHGLVQWFVMAGFGVLLGAIGLVMLITGILRRRSANRTRSLI